MNKIKFSILLIITLGISFNLALAQVSDNITINKVGISSFNASILRPLTIHDVQPVNIGPKEYVKGAEYILINGHGVPPSCQYTIHGAANKNMYVKVVGSTVGANGKEVKNNGQGLTLFVTWTIDDGAGDFFPYNGSSHTPYLLFPQGSNPYGARVLTAQMTKLQIDANAVSGNHIFYQTIEVSYNPGF